MITFEQVTLVLVGSDIFQAYTTFFNCFYFFWGALGYLVAVLVLAVEIDDQSFVFKLLAVELASGVVRFDAGRELIL
jgi:hypothetical protein